MLQHCFIVVRLKKGGVTLAEMTDHVFTSDPDIGENPRCDCVAGHGEAVRIGAVMPLGERIHGEATDLYRFMGCKWLYELWIKPQAAVPVGSGSNVNRYPVFPREDLHTLRMVAMLVGDEDGAHLPDG